MLDVLAIETETMNRSVDPPARVSVPPMRMNAGTIEKHSGGMRWRKR